jgi:hypothetical protein
MRKKKNPWLPAWGLGSGGRAVFYPNLMGASADWMSKWKVSWRYQICVCSLVERVGRDRSACEGDRFTTALHFQLVLFCSS